MLNFMPLVYIQVHHNMTQKQIVMKIRQNLLRKIQLKVALILTARRGQEQ